MASTLATATTSDFRLVFRTLPVRTSGPPWRFRAVRLQWTAAAAFMFIAGLAPDAEAAKEFAPIGGRGDAGFRDMCPAGQYLVGLRVRSGSWIDQMSITCAPVKSDGSTGSTHQGPARGGNGGGPSAKACAGKHIVDGIGLNMTAGNRQVREFVLYCDSTTGNTRHSISVGNAAGTFPSINQNCPGGEAAVGIQGRFGKHVNAVGLICGSNPKVTANTPTKPPSQGTGANLNEKIAAYAEAQLDKCVDGAGQVRPAACPALAAGAVGDGECTHLVQAAVKAAGAKPPVFSPRPYDWGRTITLAEAQRGDIVQLEAARFTKPGSPATYWGTGTGPNDKHTAIIAARSGNTITLLEQNANNLRAVKKNTYDFSWPHTGQVIVYRAEPQPRVPGQRWRNPQSRDRSYGRPSDG
jgi:hypothetical protein